MESTSIPPRIHIYVSTRRRTPRASVASIRSAAAQMYAWRMTPSRDAFGDAGHALFKYATMSEEYEDRGERDLR